MDVGIPINTPYFAGSGRVLHPSAAALREPLTYRESESPEGPWSVIEPSSAGALTVQKGYLLVTRKVEDPRRSEMLPDGARVRINHPHEGSRLRDGTRMGTVMWVDDPLYIGELSYVVQLDVGAWVEPDGSPYIPKDYHVIAPEYVEAV